jgi:hypothetical protein
MTANIASILSNDALYNVKKLINNSGAKQKEKS